jgi:hypothetical protein
VQPPADAGAPGDDDDDADPIPTLLPCRCAAPTASITRLPIGDCCV